MFNGTREIIERLREALGDVELQVDRCPYPTKMRYAHAGQARVLREVAQLQHPLDPIVESYVRETCDCYGFTLWQWAEILNREADVVALVKGHVIEIESAPDPPLSVLIQWCPTRYANVALVNGGHPNPMWTRRHDGLGQADIEMRGQLLADLVGAGACDDCEESRCACGRLDSLKVDLLEVAADLASPDRVRISG